MSASVRSRRAWGWHPLTDEWAARIVADAAVRPGELVLDIGAGHGALTAELVERGARVVAVELHARCRAAPSGRRPGSIPPCSSCAAADRGRRAGCRKILRRRVYQDGGGSLRLYRLRRLVLEPAR
jgi:SAM-dependent methyltransferase